MKKIDLGYIHIQTFNARQRIHQRWQYEHPTESKLIENINPSDIVLDAGVYMLYISYPLSNTFKKEVVVKKRGMTRLELILLICDAYKQIYKEEDESTGTSTGNIPGMLNRRSSQSKYGIWGHHLGDLMLHTCRLNGSDLTLIVDS
jgi:hypothetical protein